MEIFPSLTKRQETILLKNGVSSPEELLRNFPVRYEDRSDLRPLSRVAEGEFCAVRGKVYALKERKAFRKRMAIVEALISDGSGNLHVIWFNQPWVAKQLLKGGEYFFYGRTSLYASRQGMRLQLENPDFEEAPEESSGPPRGIVPIYRKIGAFGSRAIREFVGACLESAAVEEPLPEVLLEEERFPPALEAFREIHFPKDREALSCLSGRGSPAVGRFMFEELFAFQLSLLKETEKRKKETGRPIDRKPEIGDVLRRVVPFELTKAQKRVFREVVADCSSGMPMYRLLQGDVGSGKSVVAFLAMIWAGLDGHQAAFMAPTETLARQVHERLSELAGKAGMGTALLISATRARERSSILGKLASGDLKLVVGTHSLFQEKVAYRSLNFVVIDEQHRFGVLQRDALFRKGSNPHMLLMSATPIPRSLALTVFGDLDISVLDEMPPNRAEVVTVIRGEGSREKVEEFVRREMDAKRQVLYVFPQIDENDAVSAEAATAAFEKFRRGPFHGYPVGLLHGRMKAGEKASVMERMKSRELLLLVSTTVIEVGIDLPGASVMIVENAERFGLAQLHQLRGRVGRGGEKGYCVLMAGAQGSAQSENRLRVLTETGDGFRIAEEDLKLRGAGEVLGTRQWGETRFNFANPATDLMMLEKARKWASRLVSGELRLTAGEAERLDRWLLRFWKRSIELFRGG